MNHSRLSQILDGCRHRDRPSQKELYHIFYQYVLTVGLRYASSLEDAREIVNDTFLKIFAKIDNYDPNQAFKPWLNKIAVFTAIDYYRKHIKNEPTTDALEAVADVVCPPDIIARISEGELLDLVQQLPPAYRAAINLFAIEGYEHHEIADMLGISVGTSKSNLFKARARLKQLMQERVPDAHQTKP